MAKARALGKGLFQSSCGLTTSAAISSGRAGLPGTAYPSPNHWARSRSRQRVEQNGACSSVRGFLQMGQGLLMADDLGRGGLDGKGGIGFYPQGASRPPFDFR